MPVRGEDFFDREDLLNDLKRNLDHITNGEKRNIALIGIRKVGKTSILLEFKRKVKTEDILIPYVYLLEETSNSFARKYVKAILYETLKNYAQLPAVTTTKKLIAKTIEFCPSQAEFLFTINSLLDRKLTEEGLELILDLPEKLGEELKIGYWIQIDEFQRYANIGLKNAVDIFRERIMLQERTSYLISGSAVGMMHNLLDKHDSPLFGHFENITVGPFDYATARQYLLLRFSKPSLVCPEILLNFVIDKTGGYPYYLYAITDRIGRVAKTHIHKDIISDAFVREIYDPDGRIYVNIREIIDNSFDKRGLGKYLNILRAISSNKHTISGISKEIKIPMTELSNPVRKLIEMGFLEKDKEKYILINPMLTFWLRNVYSLESEPILDLEKKYDRFKSQISQMISEFKSELGKVRESQIREIFTKKGFTVGSGFLEGKEFDLIARKNDELLLGECKTGNITLKVVTTFIHKIKKAERKHKVEKKILFSLFGITEKARDLCRKEGIEIWNLKRINRERKTPGLPPLRI